MSYVCHALAQICGYIILLQRNKSCQSIAEPCFPGVLARQVVVQVHRGRDANGRRKKRHEALLSRCKAGDRPRNVFLGCGSGSGNAQVRTVAMRPARGSQGTESRNYDASDAVGPAIGPHDGWCLRDVGGGGSASGSISPAAGRAGDAIPRRRSTLSVVQNLAQQLSTSEYASPSLTLPEILQEARLRPISRHPLPHRSGDLARRQDRLRAAAPADGLALQRAGRDLAGR